MSRARWTVETRGAGGAWTPYSSPDGILARGLTERAAKRLVTRLRKTEASGPDGDLEYRAREVDGEGRPEAERDRVVMSARVLRQAVEAIDARAAADGVSRSALIERWALAAK